MKSKGSGFICLAALTAILLNAGNTMAQRAGFQAAGIAPPAAPPVFNAGQVGQVAPAGFPAIQAPMVVGQHQFVPTSTFAFNPYGSYALPVPQTAMPTQILIIIPNQVLPAGQVIGGGIPSTLPIPGQVFIPTQVLVPGQTILPGAGNVQRTPDRFIPTGPPIGTGRADVLRQLGQPTVSVITRDSETLHFSGGLTVFIQNGQVARPR